MLSPLLAHHLAPQSNNFNAVRLGAALAVVVSHAFPLATGVSATEPLVGVTYFTLGQHAVNLFFMLSGLVVAASLDRSPSYPTFAQRRLLRVLPGLGVLVVRTRKATTGRNPRTGETISIPRKKVVRFRAYKDLRELMNPGLKTADEPESSESSDA